MSAKTRKSHNPGSQIDEVTGRPATAKAESGSAIRSGACKPVLTALSCTYGCPDHHEPTPGELAAHYIEIHRVPVTVALETARQEAGVLAHGSRRDRAPAPPVAPQKAADDFVVIKPDALTGPKRWVDASRLFERELVLWSLRRFAGNVLEAERYLGRTRTSLYKLINKFGLQPELKAIRKGR